MAAKAKTETKAPGKRELAKQALLAEAAKLDLPKLGRKRRTFDKDGGSDTGWGAIPSAQQLLRIAVLAFEHGTAIPMPTTRREATAVIAFYSQGK